MLQSRDIITDIVPDAPGIFSPDAVPGKKEPLLHPRGFCKGTMPSTLMPARTAVQMPIAGGVTAIDRGHQRCREEESFGNNGLAHAILYANEC